MSRIDDAADRTLWTAATRVLDAGERLLVERLDMLRVEVRGDVSRAVSGSGLVAVGGVLAVSGWGVLMAAVVVALAPVVTPAVSLAIVGGVHLLLGGVLLWRASTRLSQTPGRLQAPPGGVPAPGPTETSHATDLQRATP